MSLKVITAPAEEPVSIEEARAHLRITGSDQDLEISRWITGAREMAENYTKRALITQTVDYKRDSFPGWLIIVPRPALQSVTSITYVDTDGATQTLSSSLYRVDSDSEPGRITPAYGEVWPVTREVINAVAIRFVCGYGAASAVPQAIKDAMLLMIAEKNENREQSITGTIIDEIPLNAKWLLRPYRVDIF